MASTSNIQVLVEDLLYVLRCLGVVQDVHHLRVQNNIPSFLSLVEASCKPCVIISYNLVQPLHFDLRMLLQLAYEGKCLVLFMTSFLTAMPVEIMGLVPCLLWNMSYYVNIPYVALHSRLVNQCMQQKREALLHQGPILCDGVDNICCVLNLFDRDLAFGNIVVRMQRLYRFKVFCATVIQQAVKQWMYRPNACLGKKIVCRLYACTK